MHEISDFIDGLPEADALWIREQPWAEAAAERCWADDAGALWQILAPVLLKQRAELAENERVTGELLESWSHEATPLHHQLARISMAAWDPRVDGNAFRELVRAVVGHPSGMDDPAYLAKLRAECRRVGIPVADTAEEKVARVRELHRPDMSGHCCEGCWDYDGNPQDCPCPTIRALDEETTA